jgi:hypothetical protein
MDELVILWLAANPPTNTRLDQQKEFRLLADECCTLRREGRKIRLEQVWDFGFDDIHKALLEHKPHAVHLSAHCQPGGVLEVVRKNNGTELVHPDRLVGIVSAIQKDLKCIRLVALNACNSWELALKLEPVVGCAVGVQNEIDDKVSHTFFEAFYPALGWNAKVKTAFDIAINRVLQRHPYLAKKGYQGSLPALTCQQCEDRSLFMPPDPPPPAAPPAAPQVGLTGALFDLLRRLPDGEVRAALDRLRIPDAAKIVSVLLESDLAAFTQRFNNDPRAFELLLELRQPRIAFWNRLAAWWVEPWIKWRGRKLYCTALESDLRKAEPPLLLAPNHPSLDRIYVEQDLLPVRGEARVALWKLIEAGIRRKPSEPLRFVVTGKAGGGKTTYVKTGLLHLLREGLKRRSLGSLPLFVRLRELVHLMEHTERFSPKDVILSGVVNELSKYMRVRPAHEKAVNNFAIDLFDRQGGIVALDGLDECGAAYDKAVIEINHFAKRFPGVSVIVTCRTGSYRNDLLAQFPVESEIADFLPRQILDFLAQWPEVNGKRTRDLISQLDGSPGLRAFCVNPLVLTLVVGLYFKDSQADFTVPQTRRELYERVLHELLEERTQAKQQAPTFDAEGKLRIVQRLALFQYTQRLANPDRVDRSLLAKAIRATRNELLKLPPALVVQFDGLVTGGETVDDAVYLTPRGEELLSELSARDGLLPKSKEKDFGRGEAQGYDFAHRTILEYLAARQCALGDGIAGKEMFDRFRDDNFNVLLFYASLCENPDDIEAMCAAFRSESKPLPIAELLASAEKIDGRLGDSLRYATKELLRRAIESSDKEESPRGLRVLAALASRREKFFDPARTAIKAWIDNASGGVGLGQAIRENPDTLLSLLWDLRPQLTSKYRLALVKGLADQVRGPIWEPALERLISFLDNADVAARQAAAVALAAILMEDRRKLEIYKDHELFSDGQEAAIGLVWPADRYFPARVVYKIVAAVQDPQELKIPALVKAARVYRHVASEGAAGAPKAPLTNHNQSVS